MRWQVVGLGWAQWETVKVKGFILNGDNRVDFLGSMT